MYSLIKLAWILVCRRDPGHGRRQRRTLDGLTAPFISFAAEEKTATLSAMVESISQCLGKSRHYGYSPVRVLFDRPPSTRGWAG